MTPNGADRSKYKAGDMGIGSKMDLISAERGTYTYCVSCKKQANDIQTID
jgi:hypothetical protein